MCLQMADPLSPRSQGDSAADGDVLVKDVDGARLFVCWVPKHYSEPELADLFSQFGHVTNVHVLRDNQQEPRCCALVSYTTQQEAAAAIAGLHQQVQLEGAPHALEVAYAGSSGSTSSTTPPLECCSSEQNSCQLGAPSAAGSSTASAQLVLAEDPTGSASATDLQQFFSLHVDREASASLAEAAGPTSVGPADAAATPQQAHHQQGEQQQQNPENVTLFFAKVPRSAAREDVWGLFSRFGPVVELNLFTEFPGAPTSKGCGLVVLGSHAVASAVIETLDNKFTWEGMRSPMVVKLMNAALQKKRREDHLAALQQQQQQQEGSDGSGTRTPQVGLGPTGGSGSNPRPGGLRAPPTSRLGPAGVGGGWLDQPPPGCDRDAYKLFVGNIPRYYTEQDLRPVFESVGRVIELVVLRDRVSQESKGSAFVWYATKADADKATQHFHMCLVLVDPRWGSHCEERPLVVRRAAARGRGAALPTPAAAPSAAALGFAPPGTLHAPADFMLPSPFHQPAMMGQFGLPVGSEMLPDAVTAAAAAAALTVAGSSTVGAVAPLGLHGSPLATQASLGGPPAGSLFAAGSGAAGCPVSLGLLAMSQPLVPYSQGQAGAMMPLPPQQQDGLLRGMQGPAVADLGRPVDPPVFQASAQQQWSQQQQQQQQQLWPQLMQGQVSPQASHSPVGSGTLLQDEWPPQAAPTATVPVPAAAAVSAPLQQQQQFVSAPLGLTGNLSSAEQSTPLASAPHSSNAHPASEQLVQMALPLHSSQTSLLSAQLPTVARVTGASCQIIASPDLQVPEGFRVHLLGTMQQVGAAWQLVQGLLQQQYGSQPWSAPSCTLLN